MKLIPLDNSKYFYRKSVPQDRSFFKYLKLSVASTLGMSSTLKLSDYMPWLLNSKRGEAKGFAGLIKSGKVCYSVWSSCLVKGKLTESVPLDT